MGRKYRGVTARGNSIQISFTYQGERRREQLAMPPAPQNLKYAENRLGEIKAKIARGDFDYAMEFPRSKQAERLSTRKGEHITIEMALNRWLVQAERYCQKSTIRSYTSAVNHYLVEKFGLLTLNSLRPRDVTNWLDTLRISNKRKNNTLIPLRRIYEEAFLDGSISANPMSRIKNLPVKFREPKPFTNLEIDAILGKLRENEKNLIQFAFWSGLRTSELIALKWCNVDFTRKTAYICQAVVEGVTKETKTAAGRRSIELHESALDAINKQKLSNSTSAYVFVDPKTGGRWKSDQIIRKRLWIPALKAAGVEYRNPYQTRHTYASMMLSSGKNILWLQKQMGHRDFGMLIKIYARWIKQ